MSTSRNNSNKYNNSHGNDNNNDVDVDVYNNKNSSTNKTQLDSTTSKSTSTMMTSNNNNSIEQRILELQSNVNKITKESMKHVSLKTNPLSDEDVNDYEKSFQLGVALFGQSTATLEETVTKQLMDMELEVETIVQTIRTTGSTTGSSSSSSSSSSYNNNTNNTNNDKSKSKDELVRDTHYLQTKIDFLKQCSIARSFVDKATSAAASIQTMTIKNNGTLDDENENENQMQNENVIVGSYSTSTKSMKEQPELLVASKYLIQAMEAHDNATKIVRAQEEKYQQLQQQQQVQQQQHLLGDDNNSNNSTATTTTTTTTTSIVRAKKQLEYAYSMLDSIQSSIRRKKVEFVSKAKSLWYTCVHTTESTIVVRSGLTIAYEVLELFSNFQIKQQQQQQPKQQAKGGATNIHSQLGFSSDNEDDDDTEKCLDSNSNTVLVAILRKFTQTIHDDMFQPLLDKHRSNQEEEQQQQHIPSYTFREVEENTKLSSFSITAKTRGIASYTKGPVHRLEWTTTSTSSTPQQRNIVDRKHKDSMGTTNSSTGGKNKEVVEEDNVDGDNNRIRRAYQNIDNWKSTLDFIQRIMNFIANKVLLRKKSLCKYVAKRFFGKPKGLPSVLQLEEYGVENIRFGWDDDGLLLQPMREIFETHCIPQYLTNDGIIELKTMGNRLKQYLVPFFDSLQENDIGSKDGINRLLLLADNFEKQYISNRRCHLINVARDLLVTNDYHNTVIVGEDVRPTPEDLLFDGALKDGMDIFKLHKSAVSDTAYKLMALCRSTMEEAVQYHTIPSDSPLIVLPAALYRVARDMLDLFRAIIPGAHGHEVSTIPRTAAVLHNDGVYIAFHCLTLGLEYRDRFVHKDDKDDDNVNDGEEGTVDTISRPRLLQQTCMFLDMVPLFRTIAEKAVGEMLDYQGQQIMVLVGERIETLGVSLSSDDIVVPPEWSQAETAVTAGLYHLRHLVTIWKPILSYYVLNCSIGYLADIMFTVVLEQIFVHSNDISSGACQFLHHSLFKKLIQEVDRMLEQDRTGSRVWKRFMAVHKFIDMSIVDIQNALSEGVFVTLTAYELRKLITSCFDDSPKRKNVLHML